MSNLTTRAAVRNAANADEEKSRGVLYYLGMGISGGLFALVVLVGALVIIVPNLTGSMPLTVLTSSMEPGLPPGTLIVVKPIEPEKIAVGDVITYQIESGKAGVITHRVIGITNSSDGSRTFTLKGDNNDVADELQVLPVQVQGKLWYSVPWIGYVSNFVNGSAKTWLIPIIAIALFVYAGFMITSGIISAARKRKRRRARAQRETERAASIEAATAVDAVEPVDDRVRLG